MPRGVPRAKGDESSMRFTSFHVPLAPNPKHVGTTYIKSDAQTLWSRNAIKATKGKATTTADEAGVSSPPEAGRRGSKVIVIHPGSRWLRIGRASDVTPLSIPSVIARKHKGPPTAVQHTNVISRPRKDRERGQPSCLPQAGDEYGITLASDDPFDNKVAAIMISLRDRMKFYKLRVTPNATNITTQFNEHFQSETIRDENDPFRVDWITDPTEDVYVGEKALLLSDSATQGYEIKWPFSSGIFNTRGYKSNQAILGDIEAIIQTTLKESFDIEPRSYKEYSVVLVIPDFYQRVYLQEMARMLLVTMGFKQLCAQQESLAATYGAGISNACVVNMGAHTTNIACVDDGLVIHDTRITLSMGGDDITELLYVLLQKISFPYKDLDLARVYDWNLMEDLKTRLCTLSEGDVALNLYDFVVRKPGSPTQKYGLRAYDEIILAPMCLFEPRIIEFDQKRADLRLFTRADTTDEIVEQTSDHVTQAMIISTQHLLPSALPTPVATDAPLAIPSGAATPATRANSAPQEDTTEPPTAESGAPAVESSTKSEGQSETPRLTPPAGLAAAGDGTANAPMEIDDNDESEPKQDVPPIQIPDLYQQPTVTPLPNQAYPGGFTIDVCFEASKLPLDVAIFNSARAAGGDEKIRKYLQAVLIVGGTALIPGMPHALESRLQAIATPLVPNMEKVQIIPPPKDVDPRALMWKGGAVLGKMDGVADLWITRSEWDVFGLRGLKERCFYL